MFGAAPINGEASPQIADGWGAPAPQTPIHLRIENEGPLTHSINPRANFAETSESNGTDKFGNAPDELKAKRNWVAWGYEDQGRSKSAKVPYSVATERHASVTNPNDWNAFDDVVTAYNSGKYDGIGFVLCKSDRIVCVDLDNFDPFTNENSIVWTLQRQIFDEVGPYGYVEISPSGNGYHIWIKGQIDAAVKLDGIEIYNDARFITVTGKGQHNGPLQDYPFINDMAVRVRQELRPLRPDAVAINDGPQVDDDAEVLQRARSGKNGSKIEKLLAGNTDDYKNDLSSADLGFCSFLCTVTQNGEQIWRILQNSALGRDKHNRADYRDGTLAKARQQSAQRHWADLPKPSAEIMANLDAQWAAKRGAKPPPTPEIATAAAGDMLPIIEAVNLIGEPPARQWLVPDVIPQSNVTLIYGPGGGGKSLALLQLAVATVLSRSWLGWPVTTAGKVLYFSAEDDLPEVHRRLDAIARAEGHRVADLAGLHIATLADRDALLAAPDRSGGPLLPTPLLAALVVQIAAIRPAEVIIDNLADVYGANEIDRSQVRQFVGMLRKIAIDYATAVIVLAHPSQSGINRGDGTSGSTAWSNSVRSRLYLSCEENSEIRTLKVMKANYSASGKQIQLKWQDGVFIPLSHSDNNAHRKAVTETEIDELFLAILAEFTARGQYVCPAMQSPNYAPKLFAAHPKANGTAKEGFAVAMSRLFASGRISEAKKGPPSAAKTIIVEAALVGERG